MVDVKGILKGRIYGVDDMKQCPRCKSDVPIAQWVGVGSCCEECYYENKENLDNCRGDAMMDRGSDV